MVKLHPIPISVSTGEREDEGRGISGICFGYESNQGQIHTLPTMTGESVSGEDCS